MKNVLIIWLLLLTLPLFGQDMARVRTFIDSLCSPGFYGRGAGFDGQAKAATYLASLFQEAGLEPINNSYRQSFTYSINCFQDQVSLHADQKVLVPGKSFLVHPASPSFHGRLKTQLLDSLTFSSPQKKASFLKKSLKNRCLVVEEGYAKKMEAASPEVQEKIRSAGCLIELKDKKLTMGLSTVQHKQPRIEVLKKAFPQKTKKIDVVIESTLINPYEAQNIMGIVKGTETPDRYLVLTAHYDHLGTLGKSVYFPGANDNASGVSLLLELAHYYVLHPPRFSVVFIAFGAEEAGLIGSRYFTEHPSFPLSNIAFLVNMDLMGTGEEGMMVVNGTVFPEAFEQLNSLNTKGAFLPALKKRGKAANSDHYYFTEKGVPAFFFYTLGGIAAYHDVNDVSETLPLTKFRELFHLIPLFLDAVSQTP